MTKNTFDSRFFIDALGDNTAALPLRAEALVVDQFPEFAVIPVRRLSLDHYEEMGLCKTETLPIPRPGKCVRWGREDYDLLFDDFEQVVNQVFWGKEELLIVSLSWENSCGGGRRSWVIAETQELAEEFILDVERKTHHPGEAIYVFSHGIWGRSKELYGAIQSASFDDLVLADNLKQTILDDFTYFLSSEEKYTELGIAWRRGALLLGPPGNGKTHCVRALIKSLDVPSLYVQSLSHPYHKSDQLWGIVFEKARSLRPCVLVLEDLDSLVNEENRSFFLNQLDGFQKNHGLIVIATTNHPERIDPAIINRPSRFDRKYHFELPTHNERVEFLNGWQQKLEPQTGWKPEEIEAVAQSTEQFSFAYLKELIISTVMVWMQDPGQMFSSVMADQTSALLKQLKTDDRSIHMYIFCSMNEVDK